MARFVNHRDFYERMIPWIIGLAFDSLIFLLTLWKSWSMRHYHSFAQVSDPLIALLFRDVDEGVLSSQRLIDINFVPTMPWSESRDLELEMVSSLRRRNGRVSSSIVLDSITDLDDEILKIEEDE
ncbi:hypothetical protein D9758_014022 [Tetrapyrgos nigripes]|uniref:Uncharacterized protein n=1 Tax=Tetrapyrgos nigripes TaxID=182062 RepID=A0A8H5FUR6_9AGAR|nr:hypothetical protein D9758_014022 [Tetrapyrgos nigripes]